MFFLLGDGFIDVKEYIEVMKSNYNTLDMEKERLKAAFSVIDKKGNGCIMRADFIYVLTCNNSAISREEADQMFTEADTKGKGYIEYKGTPSMWSSRTQRRMKSKNLLNGVTNFT